MNSEPLGIGLSQVEVTNDGTGSTSVVLILGVFVSNPIPMVIGFSWMYQRVIPLPETEEFQIRLRKKAQQVRQTSNDHRDTTRYDVWVSGKNYPNLPKRAAIFRVVQCLVALRHGPEEISSKVNDGFFKRRFRGAQGHLNAIKFIEAATLIREELGRKFEPRRWYTADEELIHHNEKTYAFSKQWGRTWLAAMNALVEGYPSAEIRFSARKSPD